MFHELAENLAAAFAKLRGRGTLSEADIREGLREVRAVLLEADVNFQLTREFLERVEAKAVGIAQLRTVSPAQQLVKLVYDELTAVLGGGGPGGRARRRRRPSSRAGCRVKAGRCAWWRPTSTAPRPLISSNRSAATSAYPCSRTARRRTSCRARAPGSTCRAASPTGWSFPTPRAPSRLTRR